MKQRRTNFKGDTLYFFETTTKNSVDWRIVGLFITFDATPYKKLRSDWTSFKLTSQQLKQEIGKICGH